VLLHTTSSQTINLMRLFFCSVVKTQERRHCGTMYRASTGLTALANWSHKQWSGSWKRGDRRATMNAWRILTVWHGRSMTGTCALTLLPGITCGQYLHATPTWHPLRTISACNSYLASLADNICMQLLPGIPCGQYLHAYQINQSITSAT
jgi:hypothetical protein